MRFFIFLISLTVLSGVLVTITVMAVSSNITATVTAAEITLYIDDGTIAYGTLGASGRASTTSDNLNDSQAVGNTGNTDVDFAVTGTDTAAPWELADTINTDQYTHRVCTTTCDTTPSWIFFNEDGYLTVTTTVEAHATSTMDFSIQVPSDTSSYEPQSPTITVQVSASS